MRVSLLLCGMLAPLLYAAMNVIGAMQFEGYSSMDQTVSELSAIGAPSRPLWVALGVVYNLLLIAFAIGVWKSAEEKRALRVAGGIMIGTALFAFGWPPMHLRGDEVTLTDTLHIVWTVVNGLATLTAMGFAAAALGPLFRWYTLASMAATLAFGALTSVNAGNIPLNLPTPLIGLWERLSITATMLWVVVLAVALRHPSKVALQPANES